MANLTIHGLDLTAMNIGDVPTQDNGLPFPDSMPLDKVLELFARNLLGSITFGPVQFVDLPDPEDEDDGEWEYAE